MKRAAGILLPLVLIAAVAALAYGWVERSVVDRWSAAAALDADGRTADALAAYDALAQSLDQRTWLKRHFAAIYTDAAVARLRLLAEAGPLERLLELSDRLAQDPVVTDTAAIHFWTGTALVQRGLTERRNDDALPWLNRGLNQLKLGLEVDRESRWNLKYNYELVRAVIERATREPASAPQQILRQQQEQKPTKKVTG